MASQKQCQSQTTHPSVLPASTGSSVVACLAGQLNDKGEEGAPYYCQRYVNQACSSTTCMKSNTGFEDHRHTYKSPKRR